jgi:hypothetical protein
MSQNIDKDTGQPIQPVEFASSLVQDVTLLPQNANAIGVGTAQPIKGFKTLRLEVWGTGTFTVQIQVNNDLGSGSYYPVQVVNLSTMTALSNITAAGVYDIDVSGFSNVQANITAISGGNVNAVGKWVA